MRSADSHGKGIFGSLGGKQIRPGAPMPGFLVRGLDLRKRRPRRVGIESFSFVDKFKRGRLTHSLTYYPGQQKNPPE
jgi:hypothetical protein